MQRKEGWEVKLDSALQNVAYEPYILAKQTALLEHPTLYYR